MRLHVIVRVGAWMVEPCGAVRATARNHCQPLPVTQSCYGTCDACAFPLSCLDRAQAALHLRSTAWCALGVAVGLLDSDYVEVLGEDTRFLASKKPVHAITVVVSMLAGLHACTTFMYRYVNTTASN